MDEKPGSMNQLSLRTQERRKTKGSEEPQIRQVDLDAGGEH